MPQKKLIQLGALLITLGMFTGLWAGAALSELIIVPIPRQALAAHLTAIMGGLWIVALALSFPFLSYNEKQKSFLCWSILCASYGNWAITLLASFWGVRGLLPNNDIYNNVIALLLNIGVVIPSLFGGIYWIRGLSTKN
jgi:hydroxylaminobenzene mutase